MILKNACDHCGGDIEVIFYTVPETEYDGNPWDDKVVFNKGDVVVSHGVCCQCMKNVCLPSIKIEDTTWW